MDRKHNAYITTTARMLRKNMTKEEKHLWYDFLRFYPVKFYRQKVLGRYIVDFYCAKAKLIIELDGSQHYIDTGVYYDSIRTGFLEEYGLTVIRIQNFSVNRYFDGVCKYIDKEVKKRLEENQ